MVAISDFEPPNPEGAFGFYNSCIKSNGGTASPTLLSG